MFIDPFTLELSANGSGFADSPVRALLLEMSGQQKTANYLRDCIALRRITSKPEVVKPTSNVSANVSAKDSQLSGAEGVSVHAGQFPVTHGMRPTIWRSRWNWQQPAARLLKQRSLSDLRRINKVC